MRIRLSVASDPLTNAAAAIRETVNDIWSREGLVFEWNTEMAVSRDSWQRTDIWILVQHAAAARTDGSALGAVTFVGDTPQRLVRLSLDAALSWVRRDLARQLKSPLPPGFDLRVGDSRVLVARALGYAAAHEVGHYVLASKHHVDSGLMRAIYEVPDLLRRRDQLLLDTNSRDHLRARLARAATCG